MTRDDLIAYCLAKPGAWQDEPWEGDLVVKVGQRIFAFLGAESTVDSAGYSRGTRTINRPLPHRSTPPTRARATCTSSLATAPRRTTSGS